MKTTDQSLNSLLSNTMHKIGRYVGVLIFLLFAGSYGFIILKMNTMSTAAVDESKVTEQVQALATPRIDEDAIKQLQTLKDNSVNVQALFDESRTNPFQE